MLFVKCRLTARFFHYEWHILLSVRTRKGIPVITFKIQERHAMMYIDNEVLEKMIMTIVEGFDRMEKKLDSMMRVKDCWTTMTWPDCSGCRCGQWPVTGRKG